VWWVCERESGWKDAPIPQCKLGLQVAVCQAVTNIICDAFLIIMPLYLVWRVRLSKAHKIRISAIFLTTIIMTAVSLNHAYHVLRFGGLDQALAAVIEVSTC
ncbi:hypothetical protein M422DRAFT_123934, partial [Sphaerobolus stellatus SS14]